MSHALGRGSITALSALLAAAAGSVAMAQTADSAAGGDLELTEVVITGSRITNPNFTAPTPVSVVTAEQIQERAPTQINEVINQIPAFRVTVTPNGSGRGASLQSGLQASLDLRGLAAERTLILINGVRSVGTTQRGFLDTNMIPVSLIDRVDVVTGGASAAYGSDAVAGVVNFILNDKLEGVKGSYQHGATWGYNDARSDSINFGFGSKFGDKGHVIFGLDWAKTGGAGNIYSRPWGRNEPGLLQLTAAQRAALGLPAQDFANGVELATVAPGSLIQTRASNGNLYAVAPDGTPYIFNQGTVFGTGTTALMQGSTSNYGYNPNSAFLLSNKQSRVAGYGRATWNFSDTLEGFLEANYGKTDLPAQRDGYISTNLIVPRTTLPTALQSLYTGTNVNIGRINLENGGGDLSWQTTTLQRYVAGVNGKLGDKWTWTASYQYSRSHEDFNTTGTVLSALYEAVYGCNGTSTNPNFGTNAELLRQLAYYKSSTGKTCTTFNPFGVQSEQAAAYWHANQHQDIYLGMDSAVASLSGSPLTLWAGDLSVAAGAEWRHTSLNIVGTDLGQNNVFSQGNFGSFGGSDEVKELFGEVGLPLATDMTAIKSLDFNGAVRSTNYRYSGTVTSWKSGLTYEPFAGLRFRAAQSRDIRAPTTNELFFVGGALPGQLTNNIPGTPGFGLSGTSVTQGVGNPNLKPEKADTTTVGFQLTPNGLINGFRASVDYYNITVKDAIARPSTAQSQTICASLLAGGATSCPGIVFNNLALNGITSLANISMNLNKFRVSGFDIEVGYRFPKIEAIPGTFDASLQLNRAFHDQQFLPLQGVVLELANSTQGVPLWSGTMNLAWNTDRYGATLQLQGFTGVRYDTSTVYAASTAAAAPQTLAAVGTVSPGEFNYVVTNQNSISVGHFGGMTYANLSGHYNLNDHLELFGVINNLLNREPPEYAGVAVTNGGRNINYDVLGRAWRLGVRFKY